jgi:hypothetical protein
MPELYEHLNPMPFEAAAQMEKDLTEDLRADSYTVTGGTEKPLARRASASLLRETSTSGGVGSMASEIQGNSFFGSRMTALSFLQASFLSGGAYQPENVV